MIAIGTPFIELLTKDNLTLNQYFVLYCYAYDKIHLLEQYFRSNKEEIKCVVIMRFFHFKAKRLIAVFLGCCPIFDISNYLIFARMASV